MKGVVFNVVEDVVVQAHGEAMWDELLDRAGLEGAYTSLGNYADAELLKIVAAGAEVTGLAESEMLRWVGRRAMPLMAERWPAFFSDHASLEALIRSLNGIIHPEVHKLYAGAQCPHFDLGTGADGELLLGYRSQRRLCRLAHGFVEGAADCYGQTATVRHLQCMHDGDEKCVLAVAIG